MRAALLRSAYIAAATAVTLFAWGYVSSAFASGADSSSDEETSGWTPFVVGPIIVVYLGLLVGLAWGRWRVWRWLPVAVIVSGIVGLVVQRAVEGAARAYEPELVWSTLLGSAPFAAGAVSLFAELAALDRRNRRSGSRRGSSGSIK